MKSEILIKPQDLLFFRDAKPMSAGEGYGNGCRIPTPNVFHSAIRTTLIIKNDEMPKEKTGNRHSRDKNGRKYGLDKFGSLQVRNLFLYHLDKGVLFPIPNDVLEAEKDSFAITKLKRIGDKILPVATIPPSKKRINGFWTEKQLFAYLTANSEEIEYSPIKTSGIFQPEWRTGIEIEKQRNATKEGQLYSGEYMRLDDKAGFAAEISLKDNEGDLSTVDILHLGGEKKIASISRQDDLFPKWNKAKDAGDGKIVKWVLLTPAIFRYGSLPGWIKDNRVVLRPKVNGEKIDINANFLCCSVGDPMPISGWYAIEHRAKPSLLAVAAGAVYYFRCNTVDDAKNLASALNAKNRSDMLSEKGFGFGVTTIINNSEI